MSSSDFSNIAVDGWSRCRLTDLAYYYNGVAFKPADWTQDGLPIIRIEQLNNPSGAFDCYSGVVRETNRIRNGDLVFSWSATLKVVLWKHGEAVLNQHLFKVVAKPGFDKTFTYFLLDFHMDSLAGGSHGSTMKHIKRSELDKFITHIPNIKIQQKIAAIITSIENTIEKTEALIAKYQQIKAGLIHDLFTCGVLPNGQLRPTREQAPELYQETTIGWIPREWRVVALEQCLLGGPKNGYSPREADTWQGVYVLGLGCLTKEGFKPKQLKNAPKEALVRGSLLKDGDFLISRANTPELVGLCGAFRDLGSPAVYPDLMMRLALNDLVRSEFLETQLLAPPTRARLTALAVGTSSSMAKLNAASIKKFQIFLPQIPEQQLLTQKLRPLQNNIRTLEASQSKLQLKKLGLMQDLLTGKVQVNVDAPEPAHA